MLCKVGASAPCGQLHLCYSSDQLVPPLSPALGGHPSRRTCPSTSFSHAHPWCVLPGSLPLPYLAWLFLTQFILTVIKDWPDIFELA